jgi:hypothetical protein
VHATRERRLDHEPRLRRLDAPVVGTVRKDDEIACEAIAADVARLPRPARFHLFPYGVVERTAVLGAAAVVLAVRADEEERLLDERAGLLEVETDQIVVALEVDPAQLGPRRNRAGDEDDHAGLVPALLLPHEQDLRRSQAAPLRGQVGLQVAAQGRRVHRVVRPDAPVLDEDPGLDAARCSRERLGEGTRRLGAERLTRPGRDRSPARSRRRRPA